MSFRIRQVGNIAYVKHFGSVSPKEMEEAVSALTDRYADQPLRGLLVDFGGVTDILEKEEYQRWLNERGGIIPFADRAAFVAVGSIADVVEYMAKAARDRGHVVLTFENADEALLWLQS